MNPIQRGGILTEPARKALLEFGDGYSTCDWCPPKTARLDMIKRPPISDFLEDLAKFLGLSTARVVTRCREAQFIAFSMLGKPGDYVVLDSLAHYSTYLAAEVSGLRVQEVPNSGHPEYTVNLNAYTQAIDAVKEATGTVPAVVLLTHVDYAYGNLNDARAVGQICAEYDVPFMLNAAYSAGVMPIDCQDLGVDILVSSGHKSWAASAPTGILAMSEEMAERILVRSTTHPVKELALLGCTVMGAPFLTLIASFPHIVERVQNWDEEVEKAKYLVDQLERIDGVTQIGVRPKQHTLIHLETPGFFRVSSDHKRRGFFLYDELKARNIVGIQPGLTRHFKLNTYGLTWDQIRYVGDAFLEIATKHGIPTT